ncbi:hypothetical protein AAG592_04370 [Citromicrobium bathyomarinum]|uniref:hypothetical protein n=1 Tax=Citromicrobium bathyomarinum TaxID=72174 RepID=UPI00315A7300
MDKGSCIDTDVVLKCAAWGMSKALPDILGRHGAPGALGLVHLIAESQLLRMDLAQPDSAKDELRRLLANLKKLEPEEVEITLAAELTALAQERDLPLDTGEAQLAAILITRGLSLLITGDKRAIAALGELHPITQEIGSRVACLEQVIEALCSNIGADEARSAICREPGADRTMRLVFSCGREDWSPENLEEALRSYIGDLRRNAAGLLFEGSLLA